MSAVSDLLIRFCEAVYPGDFERQDKLSHDIIHPTDLSEDQVRTIAEYRASYERNGYPPTIDVGVLTDLLENANEGGVAAPDSPGR